MSTLPSPLTIQNTLQLLLNEVLSLKKQIETSLLSHEITKKRHGLHIYIYDVLKKSDRGLSVKEIVDQLRGLNVKFSEKSGSASIYIAMRKCPNLFEKNQDGTWRIKGKN